jgi:RNA polymerase-interacting CarD/CdnL/TRCF family regulator
VVERTKMSKSSENSSEQVMALKRALSSLCQVYLTAGKETDFLSHLERLGADERIQAGALELVRYFTPSKGRFKIPQHRVMEMIGRRLLSASEIEEAIENFESKRKSPSGGLKHFHKEFKEEYEELAASLREYKYLKDQQGKLKDEEKRRLKKLKDEIPEDLERKIGKKGVKTLAADWMLKTLPCTKSTLLQIIRYKPSRKRVKETLNRNRRL